MLDKIMNSILFLLYATSTIAISGKTFVFDNIIYPKWICCFFAIAFLSALCAAKKLLTNKKQENEVKLNICLTLSYITILVVLLFRDIDTFIKVFAFTALYLYFYTMSNKCSHIIRKAIIAAGLLDAFVGFYQYIQGENLITGAYDSHVGFSLSIVFAIITILHYGLSCNKSLTTKTFSVICSLFLTYIIICSGSRIGILALAVYFSLLVLKKKILLFTFITLMFCMSLLFKSESTKGRYFIYKTTLSMFDTPKSVLIGKGKNGFRKEYMLCQAQQLKKESENVKFRADNIKHPLNEFLLLYVNHGIIFTLLCIIALFWTFVHLPKGSIHRYLLITIIVYSLFAYPFHYPTTWIILAWILANIKSQSHFCIDTNYQFMKIWHVATFLLLFYNIAKSLSFHIKWNEAQEMCYIGLTEKANNIYKRISKQTEFDAFHYNYASFLNKHGMKNEANIEIEKCNIVDYDTQLLRGRISESNKQFSQALYYYEQALRMCPNRFTPLYYMFCVYNTTGNYAMRNKVAHCIMNKKVKIKSAEINIIKQRVEYTLHETPHK